MLSYIADRLNPVGSVESSCGCARLPKFCVSVGSYKPRSPSVPHETMSGTLHVFAVRGGNGDECDGVSLMNEAAAPNGSSASTESGSGKACQETFESTIVWPTTVGQVGALVPEVFGEVDETHW